MSISNLFAALHQGNGYLYIENDLEASWDEDKPKWNEIDGSILYEIQINGNVIHSLDMPLRFKSILETCYPFEPPCVVTIKAYDLDTQAYVDSIDINIDNWS